MHVLYLEIALRLRAHRIHHDGDLLQPLLRVARVPQTQLEIPGPLLRAFDPGADQSTIDARRPELVVVPHKGRLATQSAHEVLSRRNGGVRPAQEEAPSLPL